MLIDLRTRGRGRGRPVPADMGRAKIAITLAPYPDRVPDPWRNGVAVDLFWHSCGGVVIAIATAQVQGKGTLKCHRTQEVASLNTYREPHRAPIYYDEGHRKIMREAVDIRWTEGIEMRDPRSRMVSEVAIECCRVRLRDRMIDFMGNYDMGEIVL